MFLIPLRLGGNPIYSAAAQSEGTSITNLFYWNNIIYDITYKYDFTEDAGNFQETLILLKTIWMLRIESI